MPPIPHRTGTPHVGDGHPYRGRHLQLACLAHAAMHAPGQKHGKVRDPFITDGFTDTVTGSTQLTVTISRLMLFGVTFCDEATEYSLRFIGLTMRTISWKLG
ncbi:hypothetical protein KC340_g38 [Hortaea werneckii]|nr:hypothetical protein KC340_g38 [Hortaea werneckii]